MRRLLPSLLLLSAIGIACGPFEHLTEDSAKGGMTSTAITGGAGGVGGSGGAGGALTNRKTLPDGTSCAAAPADAPGAANAWAQFLDWHDTNAAMCGNVEVWPSYQCFVRTADPRQVAAFTRCMMSDGCSSISNEDACSANPTNPAAGIQLSGAALTWFQNVCMPKSGECGFPNDTCAIFSPTVRPELRCAIADCVEGTCANFAACIQALNARFPPCK